MFGAMRYLSSHLKVQTKESEALGAFVDVETEKGTEGYEKVRTRDICARFIMYAASFTMAVANKTVAYYCWYGIEALFSVSPSHTLTPAPSTSSSLCHPSPPTNSTHFNHSSVQSEDTEVGECSPAAADIEVAYSIFFAMCVTALYTLISIYWSEKAAVAVSTTWRFVFQVGPRMPPPTVCAAVSDRCRGLVSSRAFTLPPVRQSSSSSSRHLRERANDT